MKPNIQTQFILLSTLRLFSNISTFTVMIVLLSLISIPYFVIASSPASEQPLTRTEKTTGVTDDTRGLNLEFCPASPTSLEPTEEPVLDQAVESVMTHQIFLPVMMHRQNESTLQPRTIIHKNAQTIAFVLCETIPLPDNVNISAMVDMDGDGILDIVVPDHPARTITVFEQQDGEFVPRLTITEPNRLRGNAVADIDGDGLPEILSSNFSGQLQIWESTGDNEYAPVYTEVVGNFIEGAVGGDVDGDGRPEFLVARESFPSRVFIIGSVNDVYQNLGNVTGDGGNSGVVGTFDLDKDGTPELVFSDDGYGSTYGLYVYEGNRLLHQDSQLAPHALGDTDGDGLGEIIGIENGSGNLRILESTGVDDQFIEVFNAPRDGYISSVIHLKYNEQDNEQTTFWRLLDNGTDPVNNILELATRIDDTLIPIYNSGELFQHIPENIRTIRMLGDQDNDGLIELVVIQGNHAHILEYHTIYLNELKNDLELLDLD